MGYSHYYRGWAKIDESFINDAYRVIEAAGVSLGDAHGKNEPVLISGEVILLNGDASKGESLETFQLKHGVNHRSFVKTQYNPYDIVVCVLLLRAASLNKGFKVRSDGAWDQLGWDNARRLYARVFGVSPVKPDEMFANQAEADADY